MTNISILFHQPYPLVTTERHLLFGKILDDHRQSGIGALHECLDKFLWFRNMPIDLDKFSVNIPEPGGLQFTFDSFR